MAVAGVTPASMPAMLALWFVWRWCRLCWVLWISRWKSAPPRLLEIWPLAWPPRPLRVAEVGWAAPCLLVASSLAVASLVASQVLANMTPEAELLITQLDLVLSVVRSLCVNPPCVIYSQKVKAMEATMLVLLEASDEDRYACSHQMLCGQQLTVAPISQGPNLLTFVLTGP